MPTPGAPWHQARPGTSAALRRSGQPPASGRKWPSSHLRVRAISAVQRVGGRETGRSGAGQRDRDAGPTVGQPDHRRTGPGHRPAHRRVGDGGVRRRRTGSVAAAAPWPPSVGSARGRGGARRRPRQPGDRPSRRAGRGSPGTIRARRRASGPRVRPGVRPSSTRVPSPVQRPTRPAARAVPSQPLDQPSPPGAGAASRASRTAERTAREARSDHSGRPPGSRAQRARAAAIPVLPVSSPSSSRPWVRTTRSPLERTGSTSSPDQTGAPSGPGAGQGLQPVGEVAGRGGVLGVGGACLDIVHECTFSIACTSRPSSARAAVSDRSETGRPSNRAARAAT